MMILSSQYLHNVWVKGWHKRTAPLLVPGKASATNTVQLTTVTGTSEQGHELAFIPQAYARRSYTSHC